MLKKLLLIITLSTFLHATYLASIDKLHVDVLPLCKDQKVQLFISEKNPEGLNISIPNRTCMVFHEKLPEENWQPSTKNVYTFHDGQLIFIESCSRKSKNFFKKDQFYTVEECLENLTKGDKTKIKQALSNFLKDNKAWNSWPKDQTVNDKVIQEWLEERNAQRYFKRNRILEELSDYNTDLSKLIAVE